MSGEELAEGIEGAAIVMCNDYEFELIRQKTGLDEAGVLGRAGVLVVTKGENGCTIVERAGTTEVAAVTPHSIVDPTGVGDAFRAGFMKGIHDGAPHLVCAQLGSVAATYALENLGGQSHSFTPKEFARRYEASFGALSDIHL